MIYVYVYYCIIPIVKQHLIPKSLEPTAETKFILCSSKCDTNTEPVFVKHFNEPMIRFPTWRARTTTLFDVPARQTTQAGGIDFLVSIPGILKRLQIRAQSP
jgi:hypothetical protein